jgi:hypothetical protein
MAIFPSTVTYPSFIQVRYTTPTLIATNGTFTIAYPVGTNVGSFSGARASAAYIEGLQVQAYSAETIALNNSGQAVNVAPMFTLTYAGTITFTWLGTTSIPANTSIQLQLQLVGPDRPPGYQMQAFDSAYASIMYVRFGAPATANATAILAITALTVTTLVTFATPYQMDVPRNVTYVSSNAGDTTQTLTVRGLDRYGVSMTEAVPLNGVTPILGKKAFFVVQSYQASAALAGNLSLGTGVVFGSPVILERKNFALREFVDDAVVTTGTFVPADISVPSATTGDVRGTYAMATAPNGAHVYELLVAVPDQLAQLPQF